MTTYIALLRAVNVGGTGKLPMATLRSLCEAAEFASVRTYIASGNVVFDSPHNAERTRNALESRLEALAEKRMDVIIRTAEELDAVLKANPFPNAAPNRAVAIFLNEPATKSHLESVRGQSTELIELGTREIYVHYGDAMANSKLRIPIAERGTARNMNTVAKLAEMSRALAANSSPSDRQI